MSVWPARQTTRVLRRRAAMNCAHLGLSRWPYVQVAKLEVGVLTAVLEAVVAVHLQNVDVVGEAVQQRPGETLRGED